MRRDPQLLLLDEWLAGLNPTELQIGIELIRDQREGRTIIMVEHVMDAIRSLCGRCVVMNAGVKIADGTAAEVLADPEVIAPISETTMLEVSNLGVRYGTPRALARRVARRREGRDLRHPRGQRRRQDPGF